MAKLKSNRILILSVFILFLIILVVQFSFNNSLSPQEQFADAQCGILAYDWNEPVTTVHGGFPWELPPRNNYDWTQPIDYANGTLYYRAEISSQPVVQDMRLQLCFWQSRPGGEIYGNENCGDLANVLGETGNVVTWNTDVQSMWKKDGIIIDWTRERYRVGVAVKNAEGEPVSDFVGWNWNGEDPNEWYPLDMRFTAVVVPVNGNFCGWDYYLGNTGSVTVTPTLTPTLTPTPTVPAISHEHPWLGVNWKYRVPITVDPGNYTRKDFPVELDINLTEILQADSIAGDLALESLRLVEISPEGEVVDDEVPIQFDPVVDFDTYSNTAGKFIFLLKGETDAFAERYYYLYFGETGNDYPPLSFTDYVVVEDNVEHKGFPSLRIETAEIEYYYHKPGGGFATLLDVDGNDWIGWSNAEGPAGDYRGIPNLVTPVNGGYFHPGRDTSTSQLVTDGPLKASVESLTENELWKVRWDIFPGFARLQVLEAPDLTYWFLYEGTPGGELELNTDTVTKSNEERVNLSQSWSSDLVGDEWLYFSDPADNRSLFLFHDTEDEYPDAYYPMEPMTVFGFGRNQLNSYLTGTERKFYLGLEDSTEYATIRKVIDGNQYPVEYTSGDLEVQTIEPTITPVATTPPPDGEICGKADSNEDGVFTLVDFADFASMYGNGTKICSDFDVDYGVCGGRDVNGDGKLNIIDFGADRIGFSRRYSPIPNCDLPD